MKVELTAAGVLVVSPENGTEAYALKKWAKDNVRAHIDNGWIIQFDATTFPLDMINPEYRQSF
jgi:hypothetical protein